MKELLTAERQWQIVPNFALAFHTLSSTIGVLVKPVNKKLTSTPFGFNS
jgi:hypothetical protein